MKAANIVYWITTLLLAFMMMFSAYAYLTQPLMKQAFQHLGFPDYFRIELAVAKLIGAVVLLQPAETKLKEWAYAGFGIVFISAFIAHSASGDPASARVMPVIALVMLVGSYISHQKKSKTAAESFPLQEAIL